jgi:dimethylargininase
VSEGARLEGGDVLHTERATYVGLTARTNDAGAHALATFLGVERPVVPVPVAGALHLKTVATYLGDGTLLVRPGHLDVRAFDVEAVIETAGGEQGANCVRVRDTLIVPENSPATLERLSRFAERHSVSVVPLDLSEFAKGDGSATCLSLLWHQR